MEIEELLKFSKIERKRRQNLFGKTNEEMIMIDAIKLSEEVGELMDEFLKHEGLQRKEKLRPKEETKKEVAKEFADVILTAVIMADRMNIDIEKALEEKIKIVLERDY